MEETKEQLESSMEKEKKAPWLAPYQYKKGQSGNPQGRKPGRSLKEYAKEKLATMTDDEREDFLNGIDKRTIWEMVEGKAKQDVEIQGEITSKIISVDE